MGNGLGYDHAVVLWVLLLYMSGIIKLFIEGMTTPWCHWYHIIKGDLR